MGRCRQFGVRKVSGKLREFIPKALSGKGRGEHQGVGEDAGGWWEWPVMLMILHLSAS